jgi:hypothetical protein
MDRGSERDLKKYKGIEIFRFRGKGLGLEGSPYFNRQAIFAKLNRNKIYEDQHPICHQSQHLPLDFFTLKKFRVPTAFGSLFPFCA